MLHVSTRGEAPALGFADALLAGLARDGGLYMPRLAGLEQRRDRGSRRRRPTPRSRGASSGRSSTARSTRRRSPRWSTRAYASFRHPAVCPLTQIGDNLFVLELFHGPTLAFKDVAMQLLGRLMDHVLEERGQRATIVGATSGDTGGGGDRGVSRA